jgi:hypothetical protein
MRFGSDFATRLLPKFRPTVAQDGEAWQEERVISYLNG